MPKNAWLMTMSGFFLAAALIWAVPVCGQSKDVSSQSKDDGKLPKSSSQISGQSSGTGSSYGVGSYGMLNKHKTSLDNRLELSTQGQGKNKAPSENLSFTPPKLDSQPKSQTPGENKTPSKSSSTLTPANSQPQSQTPGGTKIP